VLRGMCPIGSEAVVGHVDDPESVVRNHDVLALDIMVFEPDRLQLGDRIVELVSPANLRIERCTEMSSQVPSWTMLEDESECTAFVRGCQYREEMRGNIQAPEPEIILQLHF
jgi:hypothetical protein